MVARKIINITSDLRANYERYGRTMYGLNDVIFLL